MTGIAILLVMVVGLLAFIGYCVHESNVRLREIATSTLHTSRHCDAIATEIKAIEQRVLSIGNEVLYLSERLDAENVAKEKKGDGLLALANDMINTLPKHDENSN